MRDDCVPEMTVTVNSDIIKGKISYLWVIWQWQWHTRTKYHRKGFKFAGLQYNSLEWHALQYTGLECIWPQYSGKIPQGGCHVPSIAGTQDRTHRTGKRVKGWRDH